MTDPKFRPSDWAAQDQHGQYGRHSFPIRELHNKLSANCEVRTVAELARKLNSGSSCD